MVAVAKVIIFRTYLEHRVSVELPFTDTERMVGDSRSISYMLKLRCLIKKLNSGVKKTKGLEFRARLGFRHKT